MEGYKQSIRPAASRRARALTTEEQRLVNGGAMSRLRMNPSHGFYPVRCKCPACGIVTYFSGPFGEYVCPSCGEIIDPKAPVNP